MNFAKFLKTLFIIENHRRTATARDFVIFSTCYIFRRDQVSLFVYGPDPPYSKQKQKNNNTKCWLTGFF